MSKDSKIDVFFLIDISASMAGEPIDSIRIGIRDVLRSLSFDLLTVGRIRVCINTYNSKIFENYKIEIVERLFLKFYSIGIAEGPTHSGKALENIIVKINETIVDHQFNDTIYKKPLLFHITDGFPSDMELYNRTIDKLKHQKINAIGCGIGANADLKSLKSFSDKVVYLNKIDRISISQFSKLLSSIILYNLNSDNNDFDFCTILNPTNPTNPTLTNNLKIL